MCLAPFLWTSVMKGFKSCSDKSCVCYLVWGWYSPNEVSPGNLVSPVVIAIDNDLFDCSSVWLLGCCFVKSTWYMLLGHLIRKTHNVFQFTRMNKHAKFDYPLLSFNPPMVTEHLSLCFYKSVYLSVFVYIKYDTCICIPVVKYILGQKSWYTPDFFNFAHNSWFSLAHFTEYDILN